MSISCEKKKVWRKEEEEEEERNQKHQASIKERQHHILEIEAVNHTRTSSVKYLLRGESACEE